MSLISLFLFLLQFATFAQRYEVKMLTPASGLNQNRFDSAIDINNNGRVLFYSSVAPNSFNLADFNASDNKTLSVEPHHKLPVSDEFIKYQSKYNRRMNTNLSVFFYSTETANDAGTFIPPFENRSYGIFANSGNAIALGYQSSFYPPFNLNTFFPSFWTDANTRTDLGFPANISAGELREASSDGIYLCGEYFNYLTGKWQAFRQDTRRLDPDIYQSNLESFCADVNSQGKMVGQYKITSIPLAALWESDMSFTTIALNDAYLTEARKINDVDQILVDGSYNGKTGSWLYQNNGTPELLSLSDDYNEIYATDLSNDGKIVGTAKKADGTRFAFYWDYDNGMKNLNDLIPQNSGWTLNRANAINDNGQIVGEGTKDGKSRAFLLNINVTAKKPLIFIPGIAGSRLDAPDLNGLCQRIWTGCRFIPSNYIALNLSPDVPQNRIVAVDAVRQIETFAGDFPVYKQLLDMLKNQGNFFEYKVDEILSRRTTEGCDMEQALNSPDLFVFAYDWRKSNIENALALNDYIGCVKRFYPNEKIDILAHSMGGLVARRYILDNYNSHDIDKVITIGTPYLGAPRAIEIIETGKFFNIEALDFRYASTFKRLAEFFPAVHELLPSQKYYELKGSYFGESPRAVSGAPVITWDINENNAVEINYSHDYFVNNYFDIKRFPRSLPAQTGNNFHNTPGQDNWRTDQSGVRYFHLYGVQSKNNTVAKVIAGKDRILTNQGEVEYKNVFLSTLGRGDGTVPEISASRIGNSQNLNSPTATLIPFKSVRPNINDAAVEHNGLTQNPLVHSKILQLLDSPPSLQNLPERNAGNVPDENEITDDDDSSEAFYVRFAEIGEEASEIEVTDETGKSTKPTNGEPFYIPLDDVRLDGDMVILPANEDIATGKSYTIFFRNQGSFLIDIVKGKDNQIPNAVQAIRYLDMNFPTGTKFQLKLTTAGFQNLRYDQNNDGEFESEVIPTVNVTGNFAKDGSPPIVSVTNQAQGNLRKITISAQDDLSGVKIIRYSINQRNFQTYTVPLIVDPTQVSSVWAMADDVAGNRSEIFKVDTQPPTLAVKPVLECVVANADLTFTARFGYQNLNSVPVTIPVGANNKFTPNPQGRGQTTDFQPGRIRNVFEVTFNGNNLVWSLRGPDNSNRTSTASRNSARCQ